MQLLGELLGPNGARPVDYRDPEYIEQYLSTLLPTAVAESQHARCVALRDRTPEGTRDWRIAEEGIRHSTRRLELCRQRDEIAAERPAGCWCLGIGGRLPRYTQDSVRVFSEICDCPAGLEAKQTQNRLLQEAFAVRAAERAQQLFGKAQVPTRFKDCTLDTYPVDARTRPALDAIKSWMNGPADDTPDETRRAWAAARKQSLLLHGPYGVGKTGLAVGILRVEMLGAGGLFFTVPTLLDHIRRTYGPNPVADEHEVVQEVKDAPFLVLDDLGAERVTEWVREKLFTIINHRHDEDLPTVFTSNLDVAELGQHIGERTTWRIVEMCQVIHVDGPNLRDRR